MATATMGLRRRVQVGSTGKRTRSENNNSPSQGNLNSLDAEPAPKKSRSSSRTKAKEMDLSKKVTSNGLPLWTEARNYASIAGLSLGAQAALCPDAVGLSPPLPYMPSTMATFVGNATSLSKSASVSYLDISNMTARPPGWPTDPTASGEAKGPLGLPFPPASLPFTVTSTTSAAHNSTTQSEAPQSSSTSTSTTQLSKNFPNDSMFNTYQPWVIKTYGDLAKTKTITIKKYARILRTLRGEEVNSAENSKFRFWVKSKGFHIGQPEGYEPKPADRIIGRHAVTNPGLDPPLYVPTQPAHNKTLNGAEGTVPPGRVYKKVAIVENFFDIIHAVHVDLEGRPGKHAGQKRTYRTITETYAFLPREAVTRFLLGCTECQRRPRTPSPTSLNASVVTTKPGTPTPTTEAPASPKPATTLSSNSTTTEANSDKEARHPPESKNSTVEQQQQQQQEPKSTATEATTTTTTATSASDTTTATSSNEASSSNTAPAKAKDEKYNPLSITNLLRKDPITRRPLLPTIALTPPTTEPEIPTTTSCPSPPKSSSPSANAIPRKLRVLPEDCIRRSTSSPLNLPRPWSPIIDPKCKPIDYSVPITTSYLKHHRRIADIEAFRKEIEAANARILAIGSSKKKKKKRPSSDAESSQSESESEAENERGFSPAAGLIDTNLNLLATIQQLHCQVMLALTERLRPPVAASPAASATHAPSGNDS